LHEEYYMASRASGVACCCKCISSAAPSNRNHISNRHYSNRPSCQRQAPRSMHRRRLEASNFNVPAAESSTNPILRCINSTGLFHLVLSASSASFQGVSRPRSKGHLPGFTRSTQLVPLQPVSVRMRSVVMKRCRMYCMGTTRTGK